MTVIFFSRTSPEEFLQRLSKVEEKNKCTDEAGQGRDFSLPTQPKNAVKLGTQPSMMRDKVRERISCKVCTIASTVSYFTCSNSMRL